MNLYECYHKKTKSVTDKTKTLNKSLLQVKKEQKKAD